MRRPLALVALAALPAAVTAWGAAGHEIVATIAQIYLLPSTFTAVCDLLQLPLSRCHLAPAATWADRIKRVPSYRWASVLHYANPAGDNPSAVCTFGEEGWLGREGANVLGAIRNTTDWLVDGRHGEEEALKFLIHFLGDLHMPLHLTGRDKGGNGVLVHFGTRKTNLHSVWDNLLIAKAIRTTPANYTRPLPSARIERALRGAIYDPYVRAIMWEGVLGRWRDDLVAWATCPTEQTRKRGLFAGVAQTLLRAPPSRLPAVDDALVCPFHWAQQIHPLNCELVWPKQLDDIAFAASEQVGEHDCGDDLETEQDVSVGPPPPPLLELDTPWYSGRIRDDWVVEKLLASAGVRLAAVLNDIYGDPDEVARFAPLVDA